MSAPFSHELAPDEFVSAMTLEQRIALAEQDGLIFDYFAGGGGASEGIKWARGRSPDAAKNHDPEAMALHEANHPETWHIMRNVWKGDPRDEVAEASRRRCLQLGISYRLLPVRGWWFSPDCKHFSKAKGAKPVEKGIRDLAWVVLHVARLVKPDQVWLENVEEFKDWGPLIDDGTGKLVPCKASRGRTFKRFVRQLRQLGYRVEWREMRASDYGVPTIRKRLFLVARRDGKPIVWPKPTHAKVATGGLLPWRTAAEDVIDWSIPCPSIFDRKKKNGDPDPLVENTLKRIALGIWRYVINSADPFIVPLTHHGEFLGHSVHEATRTVTGAKRGEYAMVAPVIARIGQTGGRGKYTNDVREGVTTVTSKAEHLLVAATLVGAGGPAYSGKPAAVDRPVGVVPAENHRALVTAFLAQHNYMEPGHDVRTPASTVVGKVGPQALVSAHLLSLKGSERRSGPATQPLPSVTAQGTPAAEVRAFLVKYYSAAQHGQAVTEPLHAITAKPRFGLVMIRGEAYQIVDIGMRMLQPHELYRAQGFPRSYRINVIGPSGKPLTKTAQVRMCGNSVCPQMAYVIVSANLPANDNIMPERQVAA